MEKETDGLRRSLGREKYRQKFAWKAWRKELVDRSKRWWKNSIKMTLKEIRWQYGLDWAGSGQGAVPDAGDGQVIKCQVKQNALNFGLGERLSASKERLRYIYFD
jgi:hypothetical protein